MKILVIAHELPYPPDTGGRIRLYHLYSRLAQNHSVTWVSPVTADDAPYVRNVLRFCEQVVPLPGDGAIELPNHGWRNLLMRAVAHLHCERLFVFLYGRGSVQNFGWAHATAERRAFVQQVADSAQWDVVICETINSVELAPDVNSMPRLVSLWDIEAHVFSRLRQVKKRTWEDCLFHSAELGKLQRYEREHYGRFDAGITVSDVDDASLRRLCPALRTYVIDNGVDTEYFRPGPGSEAANTLTFVGTYSYAPNKDAAEYFAMDILPRIQASIPDVTLLLVGKDAPTELGQLPGVQIVGPVPDVRPYLQLAMAIVVPLRAGSGTRIKILEAMAAGKPVVTTSIGMEGLRVEHGKHLMVADTPEDFAAAVIQLLQSPALCQKLGANARKLAEEEYDWNRLAKRFEAAVGDAFSTH